MSLQQVEQCPVCKGKSFQPFLVCKDYTTSGELFHVEQCASCKMVLTNPRPRQENAGAYYQSPNYISHSNLATGLITCIYLIIRTFTLRWKYNLIQPYLKENLLLDVGAGTGNFLRFCKQSGVNIYGVEPSAEAREKIRGILIVESIDKLPDIKFNVITLWHVLEHIYDLAETIEKLKAKLSDSGIIFIAVPNWQSADSSHYKEMWAAYDVPRHVWHFSQTSMKSLLKHAGLNVKKIVPMRLDAYYVSLLSEKNHANGKLSILNAIKALANGYRSNLKAKSNMNYSSLIYLVQK